MNYKMFRLLGFLVLITALLASCTNGGGSSKLGATVLNGDWKGTYTCSQGLTGLTLSLAGDKSGNVEAIFSFYEVPQNPGVPSGSFKMRGIYGTPRSLVLSANESDWIENPGYVTVDLNGAVSANLTTYSGDVSGPGGSCTTFSLTKQ